MEQLSTFECVPSAFCRIISQIRIIIHGTNFLIRFLTCLWIYHLMQNDIHHLKTESDTAIRGMSDEFRRLTECHHFCDEELCRAISSPTITIATSSIVGALNYLLVLANGSFVCSEIQLPSYRLAFVEWRLNNRTNSLNRKGPL
ncbi:hypothetical protein TNCV_1005411 [Trichonephila clavipes]|nr:hypothetical protein TNCV_1005411 [Trichonephila clavipes]